MNMSMRAFDPEILQDFLTESAELLEALESDLVGLEEVPDNADLINRAFRALHTIKGSASFLALANLVRIAHAAEGALNAARNRTVQINREMMDSLLNAVDLVKVQIGQLRDGTELATPPEALVTTLLRYAEGKAARGETQSAALATVTGTGAVVGSDRCVTPLSLPPGKSDLLEFLIADIDETIRKISGVCDGLRVEASREASAIELATLSEELAKGVNFFDFEPCTRLARILNKAGLSVGGLPADAVEQVVPRLLAICALLSEQCEGLRRNQLVDISTGQLLPRIEMALSGTDLGEGALTVPCTAEQALACDRGRACPGVGANRELAVATAMNASESAEPSSSSAASAAAVEEAGKPISAPAFESTIRVEVARLEAMMNLVGELVLQKNRVNALTRRLQGHTSLSGDLLEAVTLAAGSLDRVTADIQGAVMRTRLQPLDRIFSKYMRLIRDLCTKTGKKMQLVIEGGETEVDKSVIEELGDPLVHLLRNAADHGIELPAERVAAGKPEMGTITLRASHHGGNVHVQVIDDGKGLSRERIAAKAVERGMATAEQVASMSERDIFRFIFEPGFSTAEKVNDLSGRGVGMDVVRTNIERINGAIELSSAPGQGTRVSITIPLTVAILPAMMVAVRNETFAIPLSNVMEIVKPHASQIYSIGERPVLRLRKDVLPLLDAADLLGMPPASEDSPCFAVILSHNGQQLGLKVSRLIGQQEVVIKPIDEGMGRRRSVVSGATVREDGGVSLIMDVAELMRQAESVRVGA
jgi:two-component system chemotaxis sensor kinase CheA